MLGAAAGAAGVELSTVRGWIAQLPELDFYAPVREHRLSWRGTADVVVGLNLDVDDTRLTGFAPDGSTVLLDSRDGVPSRAVLLLHPAEPKSERRDARPTPGMVIQVEPIREECEIDCGSGLLAPVLEQFRTHVDDGWGDAEVIFRHYENGSLVWEWQKGSVNTFEWTVVNQNTTLGSQIRVWENDGWFTGDDDYWGEGQLAPSGSITQIIGECGPVYKDGDWRGHCGSDGSEEGDFYAWHKLILTVEIIYKY